MFNDGRENKNSTVLEVLVVLFGEIKIHNGMTLAPRFGEVGAIHV